MMDVIDRKQFNAYRPINIQRYPYNQAGLAAIFRVRHCPGILVYRASAEDNYHQLIFSKPPLSSFLPNSIEPRLVS